MKKGYWKTRQGEIIKIRDMTDNHLYNTMCFLIGHTICDPIYTEDYSAEMVERLRYLHKNTVVIAKEILKRKILKRKSND